MYITTTHTYILCVCSQLEDRIHSYEQQLARESELRKMAEGLLHQVQQSKAKTMTASTALKETITTLLRHTHSVK